MKIFLNRLTQPLTIKYSKNSMIESESTLYDVYVLTKI